MSIKSKLDEMIKQQLKEAMDSKTFEFQSGEEIIKFVEKYPRYYFSTTSRPHSTIIELSRTPKDGFYNSSRIIKAAQNGDFN